MIQRRRTDWTAAALATLALAAPAFAGPRPGAYPGRGPGGPGPLFDPEAMDELLEARADRIADLLELTTEQRAQFELVLADARDAGRPKMDRMRELGDELRSELDARAPDAARVGAQVIEMHHLRVEMREARKSAETDLKKLLTDEQRFAFEALKEARHDFEERGGHGRRDVEHGPRHGRGEPPGR